jgi:hypothetical protein
VESIGGDHDRVKFLFLGEPYSVRREVFVDAVGPDAANAATPAGSTALVETEQPATPGASEARLKFEPLDAGGYAVARAKVPGGWLIAGGTGVTFYPDPSHEWDGASLE